MAVGPSLDEAVLERLELLAVSSERLLLVLTLKSGAVRTIFVEVPSQMAAQAVVQVAVVLNERLAGLTLREIRATLSERLRDATPSPESSELLNIFIQEADELFEVPATGVLLSSAQLLAGQPEFASRRATAGAARGDGAPRPVARGARAADLAGAHRSRSAASMRTRSSRRSRS